MAFNSPLSVADPEIAALIREETERQEYGLELIASENFVTEAILEAAGSPLTNKYAHAQRRRAWVGRLSRGGLRRRS